MNEPYLRAPHRPAAPADAHSPHAALLIDFDNVTMGIRSNLGQELRKLLDSDIIRGKVSVQRAYADWRRYPQYIASLSEASIDLIFAPAYGSTKKNATDIRLAIDALEIVFIRPEIGTFILLSGDSDFSSLVLKLKEYGKYVIGVGIQESSSDLLVQNCDEYYSYNSLSGLTSASDMKNIEKHDPWELSAKAISLMAERGDVMRSDRFKQVMLELDPTFNEKSIGFSKFNRFLTESASRGILDLHKASNGQYEVARGPRVGDFVAGGAPVASAPTPQPAPEGNGGQKPRGESKTRRGRREDSGRETGSARRGRSGGRRESAMATEAPPEVDEDRLRVAYGLLRSVVIERAGADGSVRDSEVKRHMLEKDPDFDEATLGFRKFSRFLRQAHDEEVINLERSGEGNYRLSPVAGAAPAATEPADKAPEDERRRTGRRDRRDRKHGRRDRARDADEQAAALAAAEAAPEPEAREAVGEEREAVAERSEPGAEPAEPAAEPAARVSRLMSRTGRAKRPTTGGGSGFVPGPVDEEPLKEDAGPATAGGEQAETGASPAGQPSRSMGRFRRGSRAGGPSPGSGAGAKPAEAGKPSAEDLSPEQAELVERMAREYQGVGRRTAERLVAEFGDEVLNVIDDQPGRIEDVLPRGRAQAVIDGRRAQREADDDS